MSNKVVAVNKKTGSKYVRCECRKGLCKVATSKTSGTWLVNKKDVSVK